MKNILITGVSSGIGFAACQYLLNKGFRLFGSVRNLEDAKNLQERFGKNFYPLIFDVRDMVSIKEAFDKTQIILENENLDVLINNAGVAIPGPLSHIEENDLDRVYEVNVKGVLRVTNTFLPLLGAQLPPRKNPGKIINISSVSGIFSAPFNGPYCLSKHALESMTDVYRRELMIYGIDVISIRPGPVKTQIWNKAKGVVDKYDHTDYRDIIVQANKIISKMEKDALAVDKISKLIEKIILSERPRTKYLIHKNKLLFSIMAYILPDRWTDRLIRKNLMSGKSVRPV